MITNKPDGLTQVTSYLLSQVAKIAKRELDDRLAQEGLRLRHMAVLTLIAEAPATQLEVGRRLAMDPSDVTATVDDLEDAGLAARSMDAADRRRKVVTLTKDGRARLAWANRIARDLSDDLLLPIPPRRRALLHQDLHRVLMARETRDAEIVQQDPTDQHTEKKQRIRS